jgi:hypothetical protein
MTHEEYLAAAGYSNSMLKLLPDSPEEFYRRHITGEDVFAPSASMMLGTALHSVLLENAPLPIIPREVLNVDGHRKGKAWLEFKEAHGGLLMTEQEALPLKRMVESVRNHPKARWLLDADGDVEQSLFWTDDHTGLPLKMRYDRLSRFGAQVVLCDIKTAADVDARSFRRAATTFQYHRQAAFYCDGIELTTGDWPEGFCFVTVRNAPPYNCEVYELVDSAIQLGRQQNRAAIDDLARRLASNDWYSDTHGTIQVLDVEAWAYKTRETI